MDRMSRCLFVAAAMVLSLATAPVKAAADGFEAVRCDKPVPAALMGKHMENERVVVLEARHKDIGLHDLGADEIDDDLNAISWMICGKEYIVLEDGRDVVRDVLPFPPHSREHPAFFASLSGWTARTPRT